MSFPFFKQHDVMDCGPACLKMIAAYYKLNYSLESLRAKCFITREGVSFLGLSEAAGSLGFRTIGERIPFERLAESAPLPCIVHWKQKHFVVVYKIKKDKVWVADPSIGLVKYSIENFKKNWSTTVKGGELSGLVLIIEPTPAIFNIEPEEKQKGGFRFLYKYFSLFRKYLFQLLLGLLQIGRASCRERV